jgi:hypothetical protein
MRLNIYRSLICLSTFCLFAGAARSQDATTPWQDALQQYATLDVQEKLYVHTDKAFYTAGEIVWFKIYGIDNRTGRLSNISKVAYAEIIDKDKKPVLQGKINLSEGTGTGSFAIPFSITSGNYTFRAYTSGMKNEGAAAFFEKPLTIINPLKHWVQDSVGTIPTIEATLMPEGGNLVNGLASVVGFKVTDDYGKGIPARVYILGPSNDTLAAAATQKSGMGSMVYTPQLGRADKAFVLPAGNTRPQPVDLPTAYSNGYTLHLVQDASSLSIQVNASTGNNNRVLYIVAHSADKVINASAQTIQNDRVTVSLDKTLFPAGTAYITVFNSEKQPVCERLYYHFADAATALPLQAVTDKQAYNTRQPVQLKVTAPGVNAASWLNMSLSVYRLDELQQADPTDIVPYLTLLSELRGQVEDPAFYLSRTAESDKALELLLLTQGWRKFNWSKALAGQKPAFSNLPETEGHIIVGTVINKLNGQAARDITVYASLPGKSFSIAAAKSNSQGRFYAVLPAAPSSSHELVLQTDKRTDSIYRIDVQSPFSTQYNKYALKPFSLNPAQETLLNQYSVSSQVNNIYLTDALNKAVVVEQPDTTAFYGRPDNKYYLDNFTRFSTMEEVMREFVLGVAVRRTDGKYHFKNVNAPYFSYFDNDPLVLFNGIPVFDIDKVIAYDPLKVQKIEVVTRRYYLNHLATDGIVSYTTYDGMLGGFELNPETLVVEYQGLQQQREFYMPQYTAANKNSPLPDFRNQLYWQPYLLLQNGTTANTSFYTSDMQGTFLGVIQGVSNTGKPVSTTFTFSVNK